MYKKGKILNLKKIQSFDVMYSYYQIIKDGKTTFNPKFKKGLSDFEMNFGDI